MTAYNIRQIRFLYEDVMILYDKFEYNVFSHKDLGDIEIRYTLKKLLNYGVVGKVSRERGRINYKLSKFIVDRCRDYQEKYKDK
jgi:hypothetical protein